MKTEVWGDVTLRDFEPTPEMRVNGEYAALTFTKLLPGRIGLIGAENRAFHIVVHGD